MSAEAKVCGFCKGGPVGDAATWLDGVPRPPAPCPRCGVTYASVDDSPLNLGCGCPWEDYGDGASAVRRTYHEPDCEWSKPRPAPVEPPAADAEHLCVCGHTTYWHADGGSRDCEHSPECPCSCFTLLRESPTDVPKQARKDVADMWQRAFGRKP